MFDINQKIVHGISIFIAFSFIYKWNLLSLHHYQITIGYGLQFN